MSDFHQSTNPHSLSRRGIETGGSGRGLLWVVAAIAALGLLVLVGSLGGGPARVEHPGGAPVTVPAQPDAASPTGGTLVE